MTEFRDHREETGALPVTKGAAASAVTSPSRWLASCKPCLKNYEFIVSYELMFEVNFIDIICFNGILRI